MNTNFVSGGTPTDKGNVIIKATLPMIPGGGAMRSPQQFKGGSSMRASIKLKALALAGLSALSIVVMPCSVSHAAGPVSITLADSHPATIRPDCISGPGGVNLSFNTTDVPSGGKVKWLVNWECGDSPVHITLVEGDGNYATYQFQSSSGSAAFCVTYPANTSGSPKSYTGTAYTSSPGGLDNSSNSSTVTVEQQGSPYGNNGC